MRGVEVVAVYDTAGAAKMVQGRRADRRRGRRLAPRRRGVRARRAARVDPGLRRQHHAVLRDRQGTRREIPDANKTSIVFALHSKPGALFKALAGFALRDINLTKLESRPLRGRPWEYAFYVDVEVPRTHPGCERALADLAEFSHWVRTLGSYRSWKS